MAGQDWARVADLIECALSALRQRRQAATLLRWLDALPTELIRARPVLRVGYGAALMGGGDFQALEA